MGYLHVGGSRTVFAAEGVPPKRDVRKIRGCGGISPIGKVATIKLVEEKTLKTSRNCGREKKQPFLLRCYGGLGVSPNSKKGVAVVCWLGLSYKLRLRRFLLIVDGAPEFSKKWFNNKQKNK